MSITSSRFRTVNKSEFSAIAVTRNVCVGGAEVASLSLSHLLVVLVKAVVCVLDQEGVLHGN